jgi:hypothetical protein
LSKEKKLAGSLDFGLDIYTVEVADADGIEFAGRIDHGRRKILVAPAQGQELASTLMHEICHYVDDKYAREALQHSDAGSSSSYHPTLDLFAKGLLTIFVRNWPFWRKVFDEAYKEYRKETV